MDKKDSLYELFKERNTLTTKEVGSFGYARIYLSLLVNEDKIYKVGRGVYSTNKNLTVDPLYEFQKNNKKIIYSHFTALRLLNFYHLKEESIEISVPQGYNASRYLDKDVFYNSLANYGKGAIYVKHDDSTIRVYELERSICDIIKDENRFNKQEYNRIINYYFNLKDINYQKLLDYSKILKVTNKVQNYLSLFKA